MTEGKTTVLLPPKLKRDALKKGVSLSATLILALEEGRTVMRQGKQSTKV